MLSRLAVLPYMIAGIFVLVDGINGFYWLVPAAIFSFLKPSWTRGSYWSKSTDKAGKAPAKDYLKVEYTLKRTHATGYTPVAPSPVPVYRGNPG